MLCATVLLRWVLKAETMRTTVTLDPDVERMLRAAIRQRGISFKDALNEAIRTGLSRPKSRVSSKFRQKTFSMGDEQNFRWDKALATAGAIEDEEFVRKLSLRK
jgi:hypothetical protein